MSVDFNEFEPTTREQWLSHIEADLKGTRTRDSLEYHLSEKISLSPFLMEANVSAESPLSFRTTAAGIDIQLESDKEINSTVLYLLQSGVDVVRIKLNEFSDLKIVLEGIDPAYVKIHLDVRKCSLDKISSFQQFIFTQFTGLENQFTFETRQTTNKGPKKEKQFFLYKSIYTDFVSPFKELMNVLKNIAKENPNADYFIFLSINTRIPGIIAFMRALRIAVIKLGIENNLFLTIFPDPYMLNEDKNMRLIQMSYVNFIGITGGADLILGLPVNRQDDIENARLSVNMLHIFKEEAKLEKVSDPFAGSYFIEESVAVILKYGYENQA